MVIDQSENLAGDNQTIIVNDCCSKKGVFSITKQRFGVNKQIYWIQQGAVVKKVSKEIQILIL